MRKVDKDLLAHAIVVSLKHNEIKPRRLSTYRKRLEGPRYFTLTTRCEEVMFIYRILRLAQS